MDLFTFAIASIVMLVSFQYNYYWLVIAIGAILIIMGKSTKTFIIVAALIVVLFFIKGTPWEDYSFYVVALGIGVFLLLNRNEETDTYTPEDQYGDLLKGLGGGGGAGGAV